MEGSSRENITLIWCDWVFPWKYTSYLMWLGFPMKKYLLSDVIGSY
jgi:hypothetical protein